jgi:CheY-like chemotaxis protein
LFQLFKLRHDEPLSNFAFLSKLRRYSMGGVEALRRVRAAGIDIPIIALTASVEQEELQAGPHTQSHRQLDSDLALPPNHTASWTHT